MITIAAYDNSVEAYIVKGMLEANGIRAVVHNEHLSAVIPVIGSIGVKIDEENETIARKILAEYEKSE